MQMWLLLATASCVIALSTARQAPIRNPNESNRNSGYNNDYNRPDDNRPTNNRPTYNNNYRRPEPPAVPMELHFNFTLPENGLPAIKLNMGAVSQYLNEMTKMISTMNSSSVPSKIKKTLLVKIKNPNKPVRPIPAEVFAAGLPRGALIPGDVVKPCRKFIISTCNILCTVQQTSCRSICDGRVDCLAGCETSLRTCASFCDSTFSQMDVKLAEAANALMDKIEQIDSVVQISSKVPLIDEFQNEIPNFKFYLPKCLQNCGSNATCTNQCHHICHSVLEKPIAQYAQTQYSPVNYARPNVPALPSGYPVGSGIREGDGSDVNDELLKDDDTENEKR